MSCSLKAINSHPLFARLYFRRSALLFFYASITIKAVELICIYFVCSFRPLSSLGPLDASVCLTVAAHQYWQLPSPWVASMVCAAPVRQTHSATLQYLEHYGNHLSRNELLYVFHLDSLIIKMKAIVQSCKKT